MIEVQILSKELYEKLKKYSTYCSDITQVCAFRDEMASMLKEYGLDFEIPQEISEIKKKPILTIKGRNIMKLEGASPEMLYYVGVRSEFDPTISINKMNEVNKLIENNLVEIDDKFRNVYSKLTYRNKIKELICANVRVQGKGKLLDFIDGDLPIQELKFGECKEKDIYYRLMNLTVISDLINEEKTQNIICKLNEQSSQKVILKFYSRPFILRSIAFFGNELNVAASKVLQDKENNYIINDPIILPKGLELYKDIMYTPNTRNIPVDLYRNAYYEFVCRYKLSL